MFLRGWRHQPTTDCHRIRLLKKLTYVTTERPDLLQILLQLSPWFSPLRQLLRKKKRDDECLRMLSKHPANPQHGQLLYYWLGTWLTSENSPAWNNTLFDGSPTEFLVVYCETVVSRRSIFHYTSYIPTMVGLCWLYTYCTFWTSPEINHNSTIPSLLVLMFPHPFDMDSPDDDC